MDSLIKAEKTNDLRDNEYIGMAKEYLTESIKSAEKASANEKEIKKINTEQQEPSPLHFPSLMRGINGQVIPVIRPLSVLFSNPSPLSSLL